MKYILMLICCSCAITNQVKNQNQSNQNVLSKEEILKIKGSEILSSFKKKVITENTNEIIKYSDKLFKSCDPDLSRSSYEFAKLIMEKAIIDIQILPYSFRTIEIMDYITENIHKPGIIQLYSKLYDQNLNILTKSIKDQTAIFSLKLIEDRTCIDPKIELFFYKLGIVASIPVGRESDIVRSIANDMYCIDKDSQFCNDPMKSYSIEEYDTLYKQFIQDKNKLLKDIDNHIKSKK